MKETQIFTPDWATNEMIDLLDQKLLSDHETFFFEPSCGDGSMLVVIVERIYQSFLQKYQDKQKALADTLFKFYAIEIDPELVPKARMKIFQWAAEKLGRELSEFESYLIAHQLQSSIECKDFFDVVGGSTLDSSKHRRAFALKIKKTKPSADSSSRG
jgi:hypothetical protein